MSGGEQQRVALARAIVISPSVLLFDEPLSNLDAKLRVKTRGEIRRVQRSLGITSIYVTHDQEEAMAISDRIAVMNEGRIEQIAPPEELYFRPVSEFVAGFIGKVNKLHGTIQSVDRGDATVSVRGHTYRIHRPARSLKPNEDVDVLVRPQFVEMAPSASEGHFTAKVVEKVFLGEKIEYTVEVNGHTLGVSAAQQFDQRIFDNGQTVGIVLHESTLSIL
jgi:iron(III) transport system ATP-binding protein